MAKILVVCHHAETLTNFRGELIKRMIKSGHEVVALGPEEGFEDEINELGAQYLQYPLQRTGLNPFKDIKSFRELVRIMKEIKPDVVFSYGIKPVIYGSLAANKSGIKQIYSMIAGLGYVFVDGGIKQKVLKLFIKKPYRKALSRAKAVFFQNPADEKLFMDLKFISGNTKAVLVNGSGVDVEKYYYATPLKEPLSFLLIARLIWDKGIKEYAEAARYIKNKYPDSVFYLLGSFDSNPAAIKSEEIKQWSDEGIINYLGETNDVRPFIADSSVCVLPSFYREGTPRSVLEAMSMGRPVITTDAPGCRETVKDGVNGFLIPVKDSKALADAMEKFIQRPELIEQMGLESRKIAVEKYDVHKVNNIILNAMEL